MKKGKILVIALLALILGLFLGSRGIFYKNKKAEISVFVPKEAIAGETIPFNDIFVKVAEKVRPAVVRVETESFVEIENPFGDFFSDPFFRRFFGESQPPNVPQKRKVVGLGSGFIISPDGYIVTNNHVVDEAKKVKIKLTDGREFKAVIKGRDKKSDLALLKIKARNLPFAKWGDSYKIRVGEWVLAIGNPLGLDYTVTAGIISAKGRQLQLSEYEDFIQTDAAINRGNSGGPLVNLKGEVIGVNSAIVTSSPGGAFMGLGFAIPSNIARKVITQLKSTGKVERGYLGVYMQAITDDMAKSLGLKSTKGAIISEVVKSSPADKAGLKRYDVVIGIDGKEVRNPLDLKVEIMKHSPGDEITLKVIRDGKIKEIKAKLGSETKAPSLALTKTNLGLEVAPLSSSLRKMGYKYGVEVVKVYRGSSASSAGIAAGDVILEINRKPVRGVAEFNEMVSRLKKGDIVMLTISRGLQTMIVTLRVD